MPGWLGSFSRLGSLLDLSRRFLRPGWGLRALCGGHLCRCHVGILFNLRRWQVRFDCRCGRLHPLSSWNVLVRQSSFGVGSRAFRSVSGLRGRLLLRVDVVRIVHAVPCRSLFDRPRDFGILSRETVRLYHLRRRKIHVESKSRFLHRLPGRNLLGVRRVRDLHGMRGWQLRIDNAISILYTLQERFPRGVDPLHGMLCLSSGVLRGDRRIRGLQDL